MVSWVSALFGLRCVLPASPLLLVWEVGCGDSGPWLSVVRPECAGERGPES